MSRWLLIFALAWGCVGCRSSAPPLKDDILVSKSISWSMPLWEKEARHRFKNPLVVLGHGGNFLGRWCIFPDAPNGKEILVPIPIDWVAEVAKVRACGRPVVIVSCNPGDGVVHEPGVWYSPGPVWLRPRLIWTDLWDWDAVGRIEQFVEGHD